MVFKAKKKKLKKRNVNKNEYTEEELDYMRYVNTYKNE